MSETQVQYRYLPIGPCERQWELYLTGAGRADFRPGSEYPHRSHLHPTSHAHNWEKGRVFHEYAIVYLHYGCGEFESEATGRIDVEAGHALFLFPDVWHRYRPSNESGWREYWITFDGNYVRKLQKNGVITPDNPVLKPGLDESILSMCQDVVDRLRSDTMGSQHVAAAETLMILASILAAEKNKCVSHDVREVILRAKAEIESRTDGSILIDELADSLGISGSHLRDVFKQHTGLTPYQYHLKLKISRAKALLRTGNSSIKQISDLLGFRSVFHFMKLFKGKTGMTASQWRSGSAKERSNRNNAPANDSY